MPTTSYRRALSTLALVATLALSEAGIRAPEGPAQYCRDDAGPPWPDDDDNFPRGAAYHEGTPARPVLTADGECADPLKEACAAKGVKAAYLEGPPQCGGAGWFCRIVPQEGWSNAQMGAYEEYGDKNFEHCNVTNADEKSHGGHCHGSDTDNVYGWWVRDHWFRGYAGTLHCCCDWEATKGVVTGCDYRRPVAESEAGRCRDANEGHGKGFDGNCERYQASHPFNDPLDSKPETCWTVTHFADPDEVTVKTPLPSPPPRVLPPPPSPSPPPPRPPLPSPSQSPTASPPTADKALVVDLSAGWTWIGIPGRYSMDLDGDLTNAVSKGFEEGDVIKSISTFSTFYPGFGWFGSLKTLQPGLGYMLKRKSATMITFQ